MPPHHLYQLQEPRPHTVASVFILIKCTVINDYNNSELSILIISYSSFSFSIICEDVFVVSCSREEAQAQEVPTSSYCH